METVQGKELEKIFKQEGVFDEDEVEIKYEFTKNHDTLSLENNSNSDTGFYKNYINFIIYCYSYFFKIIYHF